MSRLSLEVETRRKLGLPKILLDQVGWPPGTYVMASVTAGGGVMLAPATTVLNKYAGSAPGLARHLLAENTGAPPRLLPDNITATRNGAPA